MAGLQMKHLNKVYPGGVKVIEDFNLEIADKEFIVLVGPSGCGKSTLLRMIAGLEEITGGELSIDSRVVNEVAPKDRDIAMVFQNYALYPHMSVYDNMAFGLKLRKFPKTQIKERVESAAEILDIAHLLDRKPKALSGGQRQRVAMGRAIVREPKVFLMDEPLSNLDAKLRVKMRSEISKLHQRLQTTFIYVTHDQTEAMTLGDRIVVMKGGEAQQIDTPANLYNFPSNLFVAGFIGSPQMNLMECNVTEEGGAVYANFGGNKVIIKNEDKVKALKEGNYIGKEVIIGIRPEDIHDDNTFLQEHQTEKITAQVEVTELMGAEIYLHLKLEEISAVARVNSRNIAKAGDSISLAVDGSKIHFFDKESTLVITN